MRVSISSAKQVQTFQYTIISKEQSMADYYNDVETGLFSGEKSHSYEFAEQEGDGFIEWLSGAGWDCWLADFLCCC